MKKALLLTAYDRVEYLEQTLQSWQQVRDFENWALHVMLEPSPVQEQMIDILYKYAHDKTFISINPRKYGVLHAPWVGFERLFRTYDFVVRIEDDLIVSTDILEYFDFCSELTLPDNVVTVHGYTPKSLSEYSVHPEQRFDPWVWGTWRKPWQEIIGPSWDHDYSTYNIMPGYQSGWDWNLNTRIFPKLDLFGLYPGQSRVQNIGMYGVHGTPDNFTQSPSFVQDRRESWPEPVRNS